MICEKSFCAALTKKVLYSDNLKLSVDANITALFFIFTYNQARVGLIFHSALEKRVLSMAFLIIFQEILKLTSSLIEGIRGNSLLSIHFIFSFPLQVDIFILSLFNNSIFISSSVTKFM